MKSPKVSVLFAAHKTAESYFKAAIESVRSQHFDDWELIISDDSASQNLQQLADAYGDSRIKYICQPNPLGPHGNHLAAFQRSTGQLISILNHDDLIYPEFLAALVPVLAREEVDFAFCDHDVIDESGQVDPVFTDSFSKRWGRDRLTSGIQPDIETLVINQTIPIVNASLLKRHLYDGFRDREVGPAYDFFLAALCLRAGASAYYVPKRLAAWRCHPGNITSSGNSAWSRGTAITWEVVLEHTRDIDMRCLVKKQIDNAWLHCCLRHLDRNEYESARKILCQLRQPSRTFAAMACTFPNVTMLARRFRSHLASALKRINPN